MKVVVQRVSEASVDIEGDDRAEIGPGLVLLLGIASGDSLEDVRYLAGKCTRLRIFNDEQGRMNLAPAPEQHAFLVVSQFTLLANTRKGNRPAYVDAARPEKAIPLYEAFIAYLREAGFEVKTGRFQAHMQVRLCNDGPVTILLECPADGRA